MSNVKNSYCKQLLIFHTPGHLASIAFMADTSWHQTQSYRPEQTCYLVTSAPESDWILRVLLDVTHMKVEVVSAVHQLATWGDICTMPLGLMIWAPIVWGPYCSATNYYYYYYTWITFLRPEHSWHLPNLQKNSMERELYIWHGDWKIPWQNETQPQVSHNAVDNWPLCSVCWLCFGPGSEYSLQPLQHTDYQTWSSNLFSMDPLPDYGSIGLWL